MKYLNFSRGCSSFFKRITIISIALLGAILLVFLYWLVAAPILSKFIGPDSKVYEGVDYYTEEKYLQFEDSLAFHKFLKMLEFPEDGNIINFIYEDRYGQDNPIYGNSSDIYSIDVRLDRNTYEMHRQMYSNERQYCANFGDYVLYLCDNQYGMNIIYVIAFHDSEAIIRCVMITEISMVRDNSDIVRFLANRTTLDFGKDGKISYDRR